MVRQDRIQKTLTETSSWLVRNLSYILVTVGIVLVASAATYLWQRYQESVQAELQTEFSDALAMYHADVSEAQATADPRSPEAEAAPPTEARYQYDSTQERSEKALAAFRQLAEEYSGTRLATLSQYYVGLTLIDLGKPDEAKEALDPVIKNSEFPDIRNLARSALAQVAVSNDNPEEAIRLLNEILAEPSANFPEQMMLMRLAQGYEANGDEVAALKNYRRVSSEYAGSSLASASEARIKYLEVRGVTVEEAEASVDEKPSEAPE